jgi:predicted MFS family arabinose efflux permease
MSEYVSLLRENQDYRRLWLGSLISQFGDWFNLIASASLVANLTDTGTAISYLFLARFLPLFLFSPMAGVLLTILQFALSAIFVPARSAVLANVVQPQELVPANALDSLTWSTMLAVGALLGGLAAALLGIAEAFFLDSLTFLASAVLISRITAPIKTGAKQESSGGWLEFLDGLRYLRGQRFILGLSLVKAAGSLSWGAINVLEIVYAEKIFTLELPGLSEIVPDVDSGTATLGLIYAVTGLGTGLGPLLMRRWLGDAPMRLRWAISIGFGLMAVGTLMISLAPTLRLFATAELVRTVGSGTVWVFSAALLQTLVPDRFRGRVFAFEFAVLTLTQSISIYWAGFAQDNLGLDVRQIAFSMSLVASVMGVLWFLFDIRHRQSTGENSGI